MTTARSGRRVAVTGIGVLATCGKGKDAFWDGLLAGPMPGERRIHDFDPEPYFDNPKEARRTDRFAQLAMAAAAECIAQSGDPDADPLRKGVLIATGVGGLQTLEEQIWTYHEKGPRRVSPFLVPMMMSNAGAAAVSMKYGWQGPCYPVVTACAASLHAIGQAADLIRLGRCDAVLTGGTEAAMTPVGMQGFTNMTAMSTSGNSRPFDVRRDGFMIAEGAAVLMLEDYDRAVARGATILAEVLGAANTADAHHITAPAPGGAGAVACMELALADAGLPASAITQVSAHGTSTPLNDAAESEAITKVFGSPGPAVTAIKGVCGHALGAAGGLAVAGAVLSIQKGLIPAIGGLEELDPVVGVDVVIGSHRQWTPGPTIVNAFGFGGHNGTVIVAPAS
jgi:3-oxoacyl-[acyl-carrier-protein] synthase II